MLLFWTFYSSKDPIEKCVIVSTQILSSTTVFNIDNNKKYFLRSKSAYYNDFWRIMWHWRLENADLHHRNKLDLQYIQIENRHFKITFPNLTVLIVLK